jgi:hypothetical protein
MQNLCMSVCALLLCACLRDMPHPTVRRIVCHTHCMQCVVLLQVGINSNNILFSPPSE